MGVFRFGVEEDFVASRVRGFKGLRIQGLSSTVCSI